MYVPRTPVVFCLRGFAFERYLDQFARYVGTPAARIRSDEKIAAIWAPIASHLVSRGVRELLDFAGGDI